MFKKVLIDQVKCLALGMLLVNSLKHLFLLRCFHTARFNLGHKIFKLLISNSFAVHDEFLVFGLTNLV